MNFLRIGLLSATPCQTVLAIVIAVTSLFVPTSIFSQPLSPHRINIALNTTSYNAGFPPFAEFLQTHTYASPLLPSTLDTFSVQDFDAGSNYAGLMINFHFTSNVFSKKTEHERDFFTAAFEAGESSANVYRLSLTDTTGLAYSFDTDIFRITLGYRRWLFKKDRRVQLYSGLEWINEFNIAANLLERQYDASFENVLSERKLFGRRLYRVYVNVPLGLHIRLIRDSALLFPGESGAWFSEYRSIHTIWLLFWSEAGTIVEDMKRTILLGLLLLLLTRLGVAQNRHTISGYITNLENGEALIGVTILDLLSKKGTITNSYGFYSLTLPEDSVRLRIAYIGYNSEELQFVLDSNRTLNQGLVEAGIGLGGSGDFCGAIGRRRRSQQHPNGHREASAQRN